jgi:hypothetical protein
MVRVGIAVLDVPREAANAAGTAGRTSGHIANREHNVSPGHRLSGLARGRVHGRGDAGPIAWRPPGTRRPSPGPEG